MSKRDFFSDPSDNDEGPPSKTKRLEDSDDGGRRGRVRKKSAKVLEMEEFEQAEKTTSGTKKIKTPKGAAAQMMGAESDLLEGTPSSSKAKATESAVGMLLESTPVSRKSKKDVTSSAEANRSLPSELTLRTPQKIAQVDSLSQVHFHQDVKPEVTSTLSGSILPAMTVVKQDDPKSVIKYLLSSPVPGAPHQLSAGLIQTPKQEKPSEPTSSKKASKKIKFEDKTSLSTGKTKEKKMKIEIMSPSELKPAAAAEPKAAPSLKMKIMAGSNPMVAQVSMDSGEATQTPKAKKTKKTKAVDASGDVKLEIAGDGEEEKSTKKKKLSKKKEKLIQDAISAAKQMPNLAALVASPQAHGMGLGQSPSTTTKPPVKKKMIKSSPTPGFSKKDANSSDSLVMDFDDPEMEEDETGESNLIIAETEKKKKKSIGKKKALKEKDDSPNKEEKVKKIPKRAPTAYMLFCNAHRPTIVAENPGIEFASISRKLGELWQMQSNKQKLQWRRKAQRRMKKSNLISTGKVGKESQGGAGGGSSGASVAVPVASSSAPTALLTSSNHQKLALILQKTALVDEGPLSPTAKSFSIEPLDVAAHLKLLGESLSIIGMRLQEHKGMIAVQGSLSVLLDSLLCACGPLLCLTQQVPGMDGCSPSTHAQTLDSVAYVMPGL